jgi:hypothetical protein
MLNEEKNDQAESDEVENEEESSDDDQSSEGQSDDSTSKKTEDDSEKVDIKEVILTMKNLQKGYTTTRQDLSAFRGQMSELNNKLGEIAEAMNKKSGADQGDDDFVTVAKLKEVLPQILSSQNKAVDRQKQEAQDYIQKAMDELTSDGTLESEEDEASLAQFCIKNNIPDPIKAAPRWMKARLAEKTTEDLKKKAKKEAQRKEGSEVGDSSKTTKGDQGFNYNELHNKDISEF